MTEILVVDDEKDIRDLICDVLADENFKTREAANSNQVFSILNEKVPDAVILDIWLEGSDLDGIGILEIIKKNYPELPVIIVSGHGTVETAVSAIKMGAYDYLEKPFSEDKLLIMLQRALETADLKKTNIKLVEHQENVTEFIGSSGATQKLLQTIEKIAQSSGRILMLGPNGVGKKLLAYIIHQKSERNSAPFISFDCKISGNKSCDIEFFGESVNRTILDKPRKIGIFEEAEGGTLFIEEVSELNLDAQNNLMQFLQSSSIVRIGDIEKLKLDVRVICSSSKNLADLVKQGLFREDLYYRINIVMLPIPSLVERVDDIAEISSYFLKKFHKTGKYPLKELSLDALNLLKSYHWPGNVTQLKNIIESILIMNPNTQEKIITAEMLPPEIRSPENRSIDYADLMNMNLKDARENFEVIYLKAQLLRFGGSVTRMAEAVGMERSALHRKLKTLGLTDEK